MTAANKGVRPENSQSQSLLDPHRHEIHLKILIVLCRDHHLSVHTIKDAGAVLECASQELTGRNGVSRYDVDAPQTWIGKTKRRLARNISAFWSFTPVMRRQSRLFRTTPLTGISESSAWLIASRMRSIGVSLAIAAERLPNLAALEMPT